MIRHGFDEIDRARHVVVADRGPVEQVGGRLLVIDVPAHIRIGPDAFELIYESLMRPS